LYSEINKRRSWN